uniref:RraA-like protein n=1 Tax=Hyaloperonospora arabidopsidis (strain Emoy2) TaxID=559515 RepID=M4B5V2_HYAAE
MAMSALDVQQQLSTLSVCVIADAMAKLQLQSHLVNVQLVSSSVSSSSFVATSICGPAYTVQVVPITGAPIVPKQPFHYVDKTGAGQVIVISAPTGSTSGVFGGLLATAAKARGAVAVVTDGRVRDVQELNALGFPAFSIGTSAHGQQGRTVVADVNCPIVVAGCIVRPRDIIRGDINGVVVVPVEHAAQVAAMAARIEQQDEKVAKAVEQGAGLHESFKRFRSKL